MLKCIAKTIEHFDGDPRIVIFDARPYLSALANKVINSVIALDARSWL